MSRQLIVVDVETTGLGPRAEILEVAAVNVDTGEELAFVPYLKTTLKVEDLTALRINRYIERGVFEAMLTRGDTAQAYAHLSDMLTGNTFAGSNPTFDSRLISNQEARWIEESDYIGTPWHHRLADLAAYAAPALGLPPTELPGLDDVLRRLNIEIEDRHSALADARATAEAFRKLQKRYA